VEVGLLGGKFPRGSALVHEAGALYGSSRVKKALVEGALVVGASRGGSKEGAL